MCRNLRSFDHHVGDKETCLDDDDVGNDDNGNDDKDDTDQNI